MRKFDDGSMLVVLWLGFVLTCAFTLAGMIGCGPNAWRDWPPNVSRAR